MSSTAQKTEVQPLHEIGLRDDIASVSKPRTSDEAIYDAIYQAVLTQRLPPGTRLPEVSLGEMFGVSRSVVRKALSRLASDQIIVRRPNQMAIVSRPSVEETRHIFQARRLLEGGVVRELAGALDAQTRQTVKGIIADEHRAHEGGHHEHRVRSSMAFHLCLADACPNDVLGRMLRELVTRTSIVIALYKTPGMSACYLGNDHHALVEAIAEGRGDDASELTHRHLCALEERLALTEEEQPVDLASILRR